MSKNTRQKSKVTFNFLLLPIILAAAVVPLIVRLTVVQTNLTQYSWYDTRTEIVDLFLYNKMQFFLLISLLALIMLGYKLLTEGKKINFTKAFLPLFLYGILAFLSAVFSNFSSYSFNGLIDQFETVWVLLGYCLIAYYTYMAVKDSKDVSVILWAILISCIILSIIGFSQFLKHDIFATDFGKSIIVPDKFAALREELKFGFADSTNNSVYSTLYNPNYVGSYAALLAPIFLLLLFAKKKWFWTLSFAAGFGLLMICYFGSGSKTGFLAMAVSAVFFLIIGHKLLIRYWKVSIGAAAFIIIIFIAGSMFSGVNFISYVKNALIINKVEKPLESFNVQDEYVEIIYNKNKLYLSPMLMENQSAYFTLWDENSTVINTVPDPETGVMLVDDERFPFQLGVYTTDEMLIFGVTIDGFPWYFTNQLEGGKFQFVSPTLKPGEIVSAKNLLKGYDSFASGRGFIWGMTLPLLKDTILLGSGPDTFTLVFPQDDFISSANGGFRNTIISRPHNMFLQIGVQTGVLSLIAFMAFYLIYFVSSIRLYSRIIPDDLLTCTGVGVLLGSLGYMVAGLANDSTICVAPLFWVLIGMGMAVNKMVRLSLDKSKEVSN